MKFILIGFLISLQALAQEVYFAHSPFDGPTRPFCVSWVNAAMPESRAETRGGVASYSCQINFNYRTRLGEWDYSTAEQVGTHSMEYVSVPVRRSRADTLRSRLGTELGYIIRSENNDTPTIEIVGDNFQEVFPSVQMLNEVFSFDLRQDMLRLRPKFETVNGARELACQVVALELLQMACVETKDSLHDDILNRLRSSFHWNDMRRGLIPQSRGRNP